MHPHAEAVLRAVAAGKDVIVEKPLAGRLAEIDAVVAAASASGRRVVVLQQHRLRAEVRRARELMQVAGHLDPYPRGDRGVVGAERRGRTAAQPRRAGRVPGAPHGRRAVTVPAFDRPASTDSENVAGCGCSTASASTCTVRICERGGGRQYFADWPPSIGMIAALT
ncbi:Gfo/Idh/MocA family oxidoreductase [Microbacterium sp.]|uniref:Gfo/Idh/MocA family oxidoreductase n=1 Tax=Microbacterium sp. TaxID=51671 RepID=UPI003A8B3707